MLMTLLTVECADYAEYNLGRNMTAMVSSLYNFTIKASSVIGTAIPSILLIAVGYSVNEETGAYMGTLEHLPGMVDGLGVLMGPVPAAFGIIAYLIYRLLQPAPQYGPLRVRYRLLYGLPDPEQLCGGIPQMAENDAYPVSGTELP